MKILISLLTGFILFFFIRLGSRLIRLAPVKKTFHKTLLRSFPVIEFVLWIIFSFWASSMVFGEQAFFPFMQTSIVILLLIVLGWFLLRDFFAGIVLKTENAFELNEVIKTKFVEGKLIKLGSRSLELETENGQLVRIPYSRLSNEPIVRMPRGNNFIGHEMALDIPKNAPLSQIQDQLRMFILAQPWVSVSKEPVIKLIDETPDLFHFKIQFFIISDRHAPQMEDRISKQFAS